MTFANLKHETRSRRAKNRVAIEFRAQAIASLATHDNPVSILNLGKLSRFVKSCLEQGASDKDAVDAARKYIKQLEGNPVE